MGMHRIHLNNEDNIEPSALKFTELKFIVGMWTNVEEVIGTVSQAAQTRGQTCRLKDGAAGGWSGI